MAKTTGVTHADLAPSKARTGLGSKTGVFLIVLTILCGLACFILCLVAEATRSGMTWIDNGDNGSECVYSGSGKKPLICAASAFVMLAIAMMTQHTFLLVSISKLPASALISLDAEFASSRNLTWQAGFFFVTTWICFAAGEIMLLIGLSLESGHLKNWSSPRQSCLVIREGLFSSAGVFGLVSVFLASGFYLTALKVQQISIGHQIVRQHIFDSAMLYSSPPPSPGGPHRVTAVARENPIFDQPSGFVLPLSYGTKDPNLV